MSQTLQQWLKEQQAQLSAKKDRSYVTREYEKYQCLECGVAAIITALEDLHAPALQAFVKE